MNETALMHLSWSWVHVLQRYILYPEKQTQSTQQNVTNPTHAILNA